jgi:hypothetical protein
VLLLALGKERSASLLRKFDAEELKLLTRSAADLRPVRMSDLETLVEEFAQTFSSGVGFAGTMTEVKNLLSDVMTEEQFAAVLAEAPAKEEPVWERVTELKADTLRGYLSKEHPQTVAFILSRVDSKLAADVIGTFAAEARNNLVCRMVAIKGLAEDAVKVLEGTLREDLLAATTSTNSHVGIADILNRLDKTQSEEVLKSIAEAARGGQGHQGHAVHVRGHRQAAAAGAHPGVRSGADRAACDRPAGNRRRLPGGHPFFARLALAPHGRSGAAGRRVAIATRARRRAPRHRRHRAQDDRQGRHPYRGGRRRRADRRKPLV